MINDTSYLKEAITTSSTPTRGYFFLSIDRVKDYKQPPKIPELFYFNRAEILKEFYTLIQAEMLKKFNTPNQVIINEIKKFTAKSNKIKENLIKQYEINLMPKNKLELTNILKSLIKLTRENTNFNKAIYAYKMLASINFYKKRTIRPIIVIYAHGHANAQTVLDTVYNQFKNMEGANVTPSYNKKITRLISYAQGSRDYKSMEEYKKYFEKPDMIFYDSKQFPQEENYTTYELKNPAKQ